MMSRTFTVMQISVKTSWRRSETAIDQEHIEMFLIAAHGRCTNDRGHSSRLMRR